MLPSCPPWGEDGLRCRPFSRACACSVVARARALGTVPNDVKGLARGCLVCAGCLARTCPEPGDRTGRS